MAAAAAELVTGMLCSEEFVSRSAADVACVSGRADCLPAPGQAARDRRPAFGGQGRPCSGAWAWAWAWAGRGPQRDTGLAVGWLLMLLLLGRRMNHDGRDG